MRRPMPITKVEFCAKVKQLEDILESHGYTGAYLCSEGAMRWFTGMRHQVVDISPNAPTTVQAIVTVHPQRSISFFSEPWEAARVGDIMAKGIWNDCGIAVSYGGSSPDFSRPGLLSPTLAGYAELERTIVSPLSEGTAGNQWDKLMWLIGESRQALVEVARLLRPGMTGWDVRSAIYEAYHRRHIELNLVMLGLSGMQKHAHPVIDDDSVVEDGSMVKLVVGARYFDMIHSASQLVAIGRKPSERELHVHRALQEATLAYADQYRSDAVESDLYHCLGPIFLSVAKKQALAGFEKSAYLHHGGGPLSPLGSRDFVVTERGTRSIFPYAQFALNPVDALHYLKFELQGVTLPSGPPLILDEFTWCDDARLYQTVQWQSESLRLPTIITNGDHPQ
ncbi:MAG: hypothetical protein CVV46_09010 [Spirochaetae bacterium HGW-Spirochaetae-2]|nr:MAG: hypothetical protein CVV46_09010 [Spirochaetae bacterium HGW-Spirochaetae-2]